MNQKTDKLNVNNEIMIKEEHWINVYWKNRDDTLFENIRPGIRDIINDTIAPQFIAEVGGKGEIKNNRLYLEFVKLPLQIEMEEWEHCTRFKSVPIKAIVGIETREIEVGYMFDGFPFIFAHMRLKKKFH